MGPVLPRGASDLLPDEAALRSWLRRSLLDAFARFGYLRVEPARLEYRAVAERGLPASLRERTVRFIEPDSGEVAILPADVTPQIARMVATRLGGALPEGAVHRFAYAADLVRRPLRPGDRAEFHQVGLELVGDADPAADAEVLEVCAEALAGVGLADPVFDLSHTAVARALLSRVEGPESARRTLVEHLRRKDGRAAARTLVQAGAGRAVAEAAERLCESYGPAEPTLEAARRIPWAAVAAAVADLERVWHAVRRLAPQVADRVHVDLLEVRGFDYYTGMRFRVWAQGSRTPVAGGGRYDDLLRRYGRSAPAVGFAVDLAALRAALPAEAGGGLRRPETVIVAVPPRADRLAAVEHARSLRAQGLVAFVVPAAGEAQARALAAHVGADRVVWCAPADMSAASSIRSSTNPGAES